MRGGFLHSGRFHISISHSYLSHQASTCLAVTRPLLRGIFSFLFFFLSRGAISIHVSQKPHLKNRLRAREVLKKKGDLLCRFYQGSHWVLLDGFVVFRGHILKRNSNDFSLQMLFLLWVGGCYLVAPSHPLSFLAFSCLVVVSIYPTNS